MCKGRRVAHKLMDEPSFFLCVRLFCFISRRFVTLLAAVCPASVERERRE